MHLVQIVISLYLQKDKHEEVTPSFASTAAASSIATSSNVEMSEASAAAATTPSPLDIDRIDEFAGKITATYARTLQRTANKLY